MKGERKMRDTLWKSIRIVSLVHDWMYLFPPLKDEEQDLKSFMAMVGKVEKYLTAPQTGSCPNCDYKFN